MFRHIIALLPIESLLAVILIFPLLFVAVHQFLKYTSFAGRKTRLMMAVCACGLSAIGLFKFYMGKNGISEVSRHGVNSFDFILIPYAALALAILFILFCRFGGTIFGSSESHKRYKRGHASKSLKKSSPQERPLQR